MKDTSLMSAARISSGVVALFVITLAASISQAQLPSATLNTIYPPGGKIGEAVEVRINGSDLDSVNQLIFSHEGITAEPLMSDLDGLLSQPQPVDNTFTVSIADSVPTGVYEVRAVGRYGATNPRSFHVSRLNEVEKESSNRDFENAQPLEIGSVVSGQADGSSLDHYRLSLKAGQKVLIESFAQRLDSRMDPTLVIYDPEGIEIDRVRDVAGADALLAFTAPADGDYTVALYDFLHRGGAEFAYRLAVHEGPRVDFVFPPVGEAGKTSKFTLYGRNLPGSELAEGVTTQGQTLEKLTVEIPISADDQTLSPLPMLERLPPASARLSAIKYQFEHANPVLVGIAEAPVILEEGDNDSPESAQKVTVPCEFVGQFLPSLDRDWIEFEAKKGDVYWLEVIAHRYALESDPFLMVQKVTKNDSGEEQVKTIAQVDDPADRDANIQSTFDSSTDDPSWRLEADADATYRVMVYDQFSSSREDPRFAYRLIIRKQTGDFQMIARPSKDLANTNNNQVGISSPAMRPGGTTVLELDIYRLDGFDGEIDISVEGLPSNVTSMGALAGGEVTSVPLVISAAENAPAWAGPIRVVGKATINGKEVRREARTAVFVWGTNNTQQELPEARLSQDIMLSIIDKEASPITVETEDKVWEVALGGELEMPIKVSKRGEVKGDVKLSAQGLPGELKVNDLTIKDGAGDAAAKLPVTNNSTKPGTYTFFFNATGKYAYERNPEAVAEAEAYQKMLEDTVKRMEDEVKKADEALKAADEKLKQAQEELKTAADDQKKNKEEQVKQAEAAKKEAEEAKKAAEDRKKKADDLKKKADSDLNNIKKSAEKKDVNFAVASAPLKVRVVREPFVIKEISPTTVKQSEKAEVTVKVDRLFDYDGTIEVHFEAPNGVGGLSVQKAELSKDQTEVKLELSANQSATPGEHQATIRFRHKLGNTTLDTRQTFPLTVVEMKQE